MKRKLKIVGILLVGLILFITLNNSSMFMDKSKNTSSLLAHRGVAQTFPMEGLEWDTCTAKRIFEPEHSFIENTIPSMKAAFAAGADRVEIDVIRTKDDQLAIFHDHLLECRTDGVGSPTDYTMDELKQLDVGYGYTADEGKSYPLRGKGQGLMPSLTEVLEQFPTQSFLLHIKSAREDDGKLLARYLQDLTLEQRSLLTVYGDDGPIKQLKNEIPDLRVMSMATMKSCMIPYLAIGWTGIIPAACENTQIHLPESYGKWIWGWPHKFVERLESVNSKVVMVAGDGGWSEGFDTESDFKRLPPNFSGEIWTNRIDVIAPLVGDN